MAPLSHNQAKQIRLLHQKKHREERNLFLAEGGKTVKEVLKSGWKAEALVCSSHFFEENKQSINSWGGEFYIVSPDVLSGLSSLTTNTDALMVVQQMPILEKAKADAPLWLIVDGLSDPGNLGTIIRLADWFGLKEVICTPPTVEWYNPKTIIASMGSFLRIQQVRMPIAALAASGRPIFGADMQGQSVYQFTFPTACALVIGHESHGLSDGWKEILNNKITIPKFGQAESLNAAMATGILLSHWKRGNFND